MAHTLAKVMGRCVLSVSAAATCTAAPITYSSSGTGSGTLGGGSFTNRPYVIALSGDTNAIDTAKLHAAPGLPKSRCQGASIVARRRFHQMTQSANQSLGRTAGRRLLHAVRSRLVSLAWARASARTETDHGTPLAV